MSAVRTLIRKTIFFTAILFFFHLVFPSQLILAEDNVFYCIENKEECTENENEKSKNEQQHNVNIPDEEETNEQAEFGLTAWDYIKTMFALVFVVFLLYMLLKFINRRNRLYDKNRLMKNLGGISLGQQKSIQLVVVGDAYYLVGVGDDIRLLKEITDEKEIASLLEYYEESDMTSFKGPLEQLFSRMPLFKKGAERESDKEEADFSQVLNKRLKEIKDERKKQLNRLTEKERGQDG